MDYDRDRSYGFRGAIFRQRVGLGVALLVSGTIAVTLPGAVPAAVSAQQPATVPSLIFDGVTVVDVEQGKLVPDQRVVIAGNRIQTVGGAGAVKVPVGAQVVDAKGKYLIPGLWDMHVHPRNEAPSVYYPLFLANGVTGIRDAGSDVPIGTLLQWRKEILAGTQVGPPRQILSGNPLIFDEPGLNDTPLDHCGDTP